MGVVAGLAAGVVSVVVGLNLTIFAEASIPAEDDLPQLPPGLRIVNETTGCGSGNCYREFDVEGGPGETPEVILARLPGEECSANSLVDRRPLCVGYRMETGGVGGYVSLGKWWS